MACGHASTHVLHHDLPYQFETTLVRFATHYQDGDVQGLERRAYLKPDGFKLALYLNSQSTLLWLDII